MGLSRRHLISAAGAAAGITASNAGLAASGAEPRIRLAVSTYSYWHFNPIDKVIDHAAKLGFEGVEILHRQMEDETPAYVAKLRQRAFERGISFPMLSIHQDFVSQKLEERQAAIKHTTGCLELAARLGCGAIRLNSGRWKTIKSFDDLMKVKGDEPPITGYTEKDALNWCTTSIQECLPTAERLGVMMCLENHWGLTTKLDNLLKIHQDVNSPWLGINMDTGNYPGDPYAGIEKLAPHATIVQAKTYYGGGVWYTLDLDYKRIAGILRKAGYHGWVSLEMEGNESAETAVAKSYDVLRSAFGS